MNKKCQREDGEMKDWSTLLPELLISLMSLLIVKDSIRASAVCKSWYKASASIRTKERHLWLMKYPSSVRSKRPFEFYDPSQDTTYTMEFPEMAGMIVYYSKDGWLLMCNDRSSEIFFFNPFTRKLINLPICETYNESAAFTCAPTSDTCLVFGLANIKNGKNLVAINALKVGETTWKTTHIVSPENFFTYHNRIIFTEGLFYCLGALGSLAVFDPSKRTWNIHHLERFRTSWFGTYLIDIQGDIFLLKVSGENLRVFTLNRNGEWIWEEKDKVGEGLTIFGDFRATMWRSDLMSNMKNKLLLSKLHHPVIQTYVFDEGRYLPSNSCLPSWDERKNVQSVWIEPPKQTLQFL